MAIVLFTGCQNQPVQPLSPTLTYPPIVTLPPTATVIPSPTTNNIQPLATIYQQLTTPVNQLPTASYQLNAPVPALPKGGYSCQDYPCPEDTAGWESRIQLPPGFRATYFAQVLGKPNTITFGPDGLLYVAMMEGQILTIDPQGNIKTFLEGLNVPVGLAFSPEGNLYISDRANDNEGQVLVWEKGKLYQLFAGIPCCYVGMHAANGLVFGPDGYGYLAVGARADHGEILDTDIQDELHPWEASILRFSPDGKEISVYARGLRNAYDLTFDSVGRLFAADNAPDFGPADEFHLVMPGAEHGYPWYSCDHCFPAPADVNLVPPLHELIPHGAPTGITAYTASQFPGYGNNIFLTLWSAFEGAQKVVRFGAGGEGMTDFATGFAAPIDVAVAPDGSLYVADWAVGVIFHITYEN